MITIGVTTYNRLNTLQRMAHSFFISDLSYDYNIRVYDDASTEYDEFFLRELFPKARRIYVQDHNLGSDANIRYMYEDFLNSEDDFFFNADSDLIFHQNWLNTLLQVVSETDGVLSALNTKRHKDIGTRIIKGYDLVVKSDLGSAGCMFSREIVELIIKQLSNESSSGFDWKWSDIICDSGKKLYALKNSMVQHIGLSGYNSERGRVDYGEGFVVDSCENGQFINDSLHEALVFSDKGNNKNAVYSVFPFGLVEKDSRVVIYGMGNYGKEYYKQILATGFCKITGLVDQHPDKSIGVLSPEAVLTMEYDYIVISIYNPGIVRIIKTELMNMGVNECKIVSGACDRIVR